MWKQDLLLLLRRGRSIIRREWKLLFFSNPACTNPHSTCHCEEEGQSSEVNKKSSSPLSCGPVSKQDSTTCSYYEEEGELLSSSYPVGVKTGQLKLWLLWRRRSIIQSDQVGSAVLRNKTAQLLVKVKRRGSIIRSVWEQLPSSSPVNVKTGQHNLLLLCREGSIIRHEWEQPFFSYPVCVKTGHHLLLLLSGGSFIRSEWELLFSSYPIGVKTGQQTLLLLERRRSIIRSDQVGTVVLQFSCRCQTTTAPLVTVKRKDRHSKRLSGICCSPVLL